jgi:hypothetical protein
LGTEKRREFSQHPLIFHHRSPHLRNHLALVHSGIPGLVGGKAQFLHGLPCLLSYLSQLFSRIPFVLGTLTTALCVPPISLCCCSGDFRSSAVHLRLSVVGFLQLVFHCVRPARLSFRRSSTRSL